MHCKGLSFAGENLEVPVLEKLPAHRSHVERDLIIRGLCKCSEREGKLSPVKVKRTATLVAQM